MAGVYGIMTLISRDNLFTVAHKEVMEEAFAEVKTGCGMLNELWEEIELTPGRVYAECYYDLEYDDNEKIREAVVDICMKIALSAPAKAFMCKYTFDYSAVDCTYYLLVFFKDQQLDIFKAYRDDMGWRESARKTMSLKDGAFEVTREEDLPDQYGEYDDWGDEMGGEWDDEDFDSESEEESYSEQAEDGAKNPVPDLLDAFDDYQFPEV